MYKIEPNNWYSLKEASEILWYRVPKSLKHIIKKWYFEKENINIKWTELKKRYEIKWQGILDYIKRLNG